MGLTSVSVQFSLSVLIFFNIWGPCWFADGESYKTYVTTEEPTFENSSALNKMVISKSATYESDPSKQNWLETSHLSNKSKQKRAIIQTGVSVLEFASTIMTIYSFAEEKIKEASESEEKDLAFRQLVTEDLRHIRELLEKSSKAQEIEQLRTRLWPEEKVIRACDRLLLRLSEIGLNGPSSTKTEFLATAAGLQGSMFAILDQLASVTVFSPKPYLESLKELTKNFRSEAARVIGLLTIGSSFLATYHQLSNVTANERNITLKHLNETEIQATRKIEEIATFCRYYRRRVEKEMEEIMVNNSDESNSKVASEILKFLTNEYDNESWLVIVTKETAANKQAGRAVSGGLNTFRVSRKGGKGAVAFSQNKNFICPNNHDRLVKMIERKSRPVEGCRHTLCPDPATYTKETYEKILEDAASLQLSVNNLALIYAYDNRYATRVSASPAFCYSEFELFFPITPAAGFNSWHSDPSAYYMAIVSVQSDLMNPHFRFLPKEIANFIWDLNPLASGLKYDNI